MEQKRILSVKQSYDYAAGYFGLMLPLATFNSFSYSFVIYVIGLDEFLASIGTSIGLFCMAFGGIIWGYLSDKKKPGRMGKRRPFLLVGAPIFSILFVFFWIFPVKCAYSGEPNITVAIYYWILCAAFCTIYMMVWAPYMAMLPDISNDETNRIQIASKQGLFNMFATVIGLLLPFILMAQVDNPQEQLFYTQPGGQLLINQMIAVSIIFSIATTLTIYLTYFRIKEPITASNLDGIVAAQQKETFSDVLHGFVMPFRNRDFAWWSANNFIFNFGMRIPMTILMGFLTYVLELQGSMFIIFILLVLPFVGAGFVVWNKLTVKWGLKKAFLTVLLLLFSFMLSGSVFLFDLKDPLRFILVLIIIIILVSCLIALFILPNTIVSKIIDLEIKKTIYIKGELSEDEKFQFSGKFFGANALMINLSGAAAFQLIGIVLSGNKDNPMILSFTLPITGIIMLIAYLFARKISLEDKNN